MTTSRVRILFAVVADEGNYNAQCLNAQEIALRLDPERFLSTLFYLRRPAPGLRGQPHVRLVGLPPRLGSLVMAKEMIWGRHDLLFYVRPGRASRLYWKLRRLGRGKKVMATVEASADHIAALPASRRRELVGCLERADVTYAITEPARDAIRAGFGLEIADRVIPVGVDLEIFRPAPRDHHQPPWKVLFVGSFQPNKRPHLLLDLARRLGGEEVEFHLIGGTLGRPGYLGGLKADRDRQRLANVFFHDPLPPAGIAEWMRKADVFVLPSRHEGLPKVTLEAAATGLPCIVFSHYRTPSVVDGVTGFQVDNPEALGSRLRQLLADRELRRRMGARAAEHARRFDWQTVVPRWQEAFLSLLGGAR